MKPIGRTKNPLVVRTDFSNAKAWDTIREIIRRPVDDGYLANVGYLDESAYDGVTKQALLDLVTSKHDHAFMVVADRVAMSKREHPLLVVSLDEDRGREFRALPSQIQSIENNLSLANMDFAEFADNVGKDGVFRGF
jgi:hypothetical protein